LSIPGIVTHFAVLKDPRVDRTKKHRLVDIIAIAFCATICGAEGWEEMEQFGLAKEDWLRENLGLELAHGIPSDDTFRRLFARLDPEAFGECFVNWVRSFHRKCDGEVIALDGKTLRHSFDTATGRRAVHLVNAWATESGLALGQVKVDGKSNEITALPRLLRLLDIAGCIVTADAMGCQKATARQVIEQGGDYALALKANQESLHEDVRLFFENARANNFFGKDAQRRITHRYYETVEKDHGRIETRRYWMVEGKQIEWLPQKDDWKGLASLCAVESERRIGEKVSRETRYFISSVSGSVKWLANAVRAHWGIENSLHRVLDVAFGEDDSDIRKDHAAENYGTLRKAAVNLLKQDKIAKSGIKARSKKAAWDDSYLLKILAG
jgi:predicted transposase YbfD/YdcC